MTGTSFGPVGQLAYVVADIDYSMRTWIESMGVGPWVVIRDMEFTGHYEGAPTAVRLHLALAYDGDRQIELIQQLNDDPSPYLGYRQQGHFGLHHLGYFFAGDFDDAAARAERQGLHLRYAVSTSMGLRYHYYSLPDTPGSFIEFIELDDMTTALFEDLKQRELAPDGSNAIEEISV